MNTNIYVRKLIQATHLVLQVSGQDNVHEEELKKNIKTNMRQCRDLQLIGSIIFNPCSTVMYAQCLQKKVGATGPRDRLIYLC